MNKQTPILTCQQASKQFSEGRYTLSVLNNINLSVAAGEQIAIVGSSGSGKTTLLHLLGGLDKPSTGSILINGQNIQNLSARKLSQMRNQYLGFVYQFHHLLPEFDALENVCMPLLIRKTTPELARQAAINILSQVGLGQRLHHKVGELSGGERQRVAIARALVTKPLCVLADEPTGNLDKCTAEQVYEIMLDLNKSMQTALVLVTHDHDLAKRMDKQYTIVDGMLQAL